MVLAVPSLDILLLSAPHPLSPVPAGREIDRLSRVRVGPTHPVFGSQGFRGGHERTFDLLDDYRVPVLRGYLLRVKKGHGSLVLGRRRAWRDVSERSSAGGLTAGDVARRGEQTADAVRKQLQVMAAAGLVVKVKGLWFRVRWHPGRLAQELGVADVPAKRKARHEQARSDSWEDRTKLSVGHRLRVDRISDGSTICYVHPDTGEMLWSTTVKPPKQE